MNEEIFDIALAAEQDKKRMEEVSEAKQKAHNKSNVTGANDDKDSQINKSAISSTIRKTTEPKVGDNLDPLAAQEKKSNLDLEEDGEEEGEEEQPQGPSPEEIYHMEMKDKCMSELVDIQPLGFNLRQWLVEKLDDGYYLSINPESVFPEHCILVRGDKYVWHEPFGRKAVEGEDYGGANQFSTNQMSAMESTSMNTKVTQSKPMLYFDFSRCQKTRVITDEAAEVFEEEKTAQKNSSYINSRFWDPHAPFSEKDLSQITSLVSSLDAYCLHRIPPSSFKDLRSFVNNTIHLIPRDTLLDITNKLNNQIFKEKNLDFEKLFSDKNELEREDIKEARILNSLLLKKDRERVFQEDIEREEYLIEIKKKRAEEKRLKEIEEKLRQEESQMGRGRKKRGGTERQGTTITGKSEITENDVDKSFTSGVKGLGNSNNTGAGGVNGNLKTEEAGANFNVNLNENNLNNTIVTTGNDTNDGKGLLKSDRESPDLSPSPSMLVGPLGIEKDEILAAYTNPYKNLFYLVSKFLF